MRMAPPIPTTTPMMMFFWDDVMPELPEPAFPPFRLGEPVDVGLLEVGALLVMTFEKVLLPLTVTIVVVTSASDSAVGAAVVVIKAVLLMGSLDSAVGDGAFVVLAGVGVVDRSTVVRSGDDEGCVGEVDAALELVVTGEDSDGVGDADSAAELEGAAEDEPPVPTGVLWPWRLCRWRCASTSVAHTAAMMKMANRKNNGILDARYMLWETDV
jgi:hypothetical protein